MLAEKESRTDASSWRGPKLDLVWRRFTVRLSSSAMLFTTCKTERERFYLSTRTAMDGTGLWP
jgi:hypothetical protein